MATLVQTSQNFWAKFFDYCTKSFQCLSKNPGLFLMRKLARIEWIRNAISFLYKLPSKSYTINSTQEDSVFADIDVDQMASSINTDSYVAGINLPPEVIQEILDYAYSSPCYADRNQNTSFRYHQKEQAQASLGRPIRLGSYFHGQGCAAIRKLENDPKILALAAKFLGTTPVHVATELWWSFPVAGTSFEQLKAAQVFHYDLDDYRFIKFFFYLTDVDHTNGPHVLLRGSHKNKKLTHQLLGVRCASKDDQEILDCYGAENLVTVCGPAGLGFAEDSTCFHKGSLPSENERLLLQIEFAINSYGDIRGMAS